MLYELEQGPTEVAILKQCKRFKQPIPVAIANAPSLLPGLEFYYGGFQDLTTCRSPGGMSEGAIPWTVKHQWCDRNNVYGEQREDFIYLITHLDIEYRNFLAAKSNQKPPVKVKRHRG